MKRPKFQKVQRGDKLADVLRYDTHNAAVAAAESHQTSRNQQRANQPPDAVATSTTLFKCRNDSTGSPSALKSFAVVGLDGPVVGSAANLDEFKFRTSLSIVTPAAKHVAPCPKWGITYGEIRSAGWGRVIVAGIVPCEIDIQSTDHHRAFAEVGQSAYLVSGADGEADIISKATPSLTGRQWCLIRFGGGGDAGVCGSGSGSGSGSGTGSGSPCDTQFSSIAIGTTAPAYVLGVDALGCVRRYPVTDCGNTGSGG